MGAYDHLDAAALTQPGGFADSLTKALTAAIQGYGNAQDRIDSRAGEMARLAIGDKRNQEQDNRAKVMLDLALAQHGAYHGEDAGLLKTNQDALDESDMRELFRKAQAEDLQSRATSRTTNQGLNIAKGLVGTVAPLVGLTYKDGVYSYPKGSAEAVEKPPAIHNFGDSVTPNYRQWDPATKTWQAIKFPEEAGAALPPDDATAPANGGPGFLQRMSDSVGSLADSVGGLFADAPPQPRAAVAAPQAPTRMPMKSRNAMGPATGRAASADQQEPAGPATGSASPSAPWQAAAAKSLQGIKATADQAAITPEQRAKYLSTMNDLHQRWQAAGAAGKRAEADRIKQVIANYSKIIDQTPGQ